MAYNEKTKENLRMIEPGEVKNPKGRGKGVKNRATILKELLAIKIKVKNPLKGNKEQKMSVEEIINTAQVKKAIAGDSKAYELITNSLYGKIPIDINLGGQEENPVVIDKKVPELTFAQLYEIKYGKPYEPKPEKKSDK